MNSQNNHWLTLTRQDEPMLMKTNHPIHIMVFGVITSGANVCLHLSSYIVSYSTRRPTPSAWVTARRSRVKQNDVAPCHTSKRIQSWLWETSSQIFGHLLPDFNLFDYYVLDTVEREINKTPSNTKNEEKTRAAAAFNNLNTETVGKLTIPKITSDRN